MERALLFLDRRAHARAELERKLTQRAFGPEVIASTMAELERLGLMDDFIFARLYIESRHQGSRALGPRRITAELRRR